MTLEGSFHALVAADDATCWPWLMCAVCDLYTATQMGALDCWCVRKELHTLSYNQANLSVVLLSTTSAYLHSLATLTSTNRVYAGTSLTCPFY